METEFVLSLGEQRWTLPTGADTITIGRASNADIRLQADDQISRIHARLTRDGATWTLHDESRNGTGLNGHRLTSPTALTTGDRIHIGRSILTFHKSTLPSPNATTPPAPPLTPPAPPSTPPSTPSAPPSSPTPPSTSSAPPSTPASPAPVPSASAPPATVPSAPNPDVQRPADPVQTPQAHRDQPSPGATFPTDPAAPDEQLFPARAFPNDPDLAPDGPPHQSPSAPPAYPADALSTRDPAPDGPPHQSSSVAPAYPTDALSTPDHVRRDRPTPASSHRADPVPASHGRHDQAPAGTFPTDPFATDRASTPDAPNHPTPPSSPVDRAPATPNPFTPDDRAAAGSSPFAPDREPAGTNPFTPDDRAPASTNPFTQDDHAPAGTSPFTPDDRAAAGSSPFAPDREPAGTNAFTPDDRAPAGTNPFTSDDHAPAGTNPFTPDDRAADGANPFVAAGPGVGRDDDEYDVAGVVPGFDGGDGAVRSGDAGAWAAYPSADNPEPVRSPAEISAQIDQSGPNWNASDSWPDPGLATADRRNADQRTPADHRATSDRSPTTDRRTARSARLPGTADPDDTDAVGTVRLARVLIAAGGVIVLGLIVNLVVTFLSDGPGSPLRWLIPPVIALIVAMALALTDAATTKYDRRGPLDVSVLVAIAVVLVGVGVGGFALTAGTEYVGGYLTGNESGEDRLIKPVAKTGSGITVTVENVTYTGHFTRVEVTVANAAKQPVTIPLDGTTFTAADGTALRADTGKSSWPSAIPAGGSEHGTITFEGHLPDSATAAVLTFKSGDTTFSVPGVTLSR